MLQEETVRSDLDSFFLSPSTFLHKIVAFLFQEISEIIKEANEVLSQVRGTQEAMEDAKMFKVRQEMGD